MNAKPDGTAAGSWLQRAQAEDQPSRHQPGDGACASGPSVHGPAPAWDPYDVWLSRIERPRRLRAACTVV